MSWFQDLAGRAENILNKIDKNAAAVLTESNASNSVEEFSDTTDGIFHNNHELIDLFDTSANHVRSEAAEDVSVEGELEVPLKESSPSSKTVSSQNSFILSEEVQLLNGKINKLELDNQELNKQLLNYQHLSSQIRQENAKLQLDLDSANTTASNAREEMEQYKARAQRIFQEKEELFSQKKRDGEEMPQNEIITYNTELKKELEFQLNKNSELEEKLSRLNQANKQVHQQIMTLQNQLHETTQELQEKVAKETKLRSIIEEECHLKTRELQEKYNEILTQNDVISSKDQEIVRLQQLLKQKPNSNYDSRIKSLTDTLISKQSTLEATTTEKNALRLQIEKLENEYQKNLAQLKRAQVRVINVNDTDDDKSQVPRFLRVTPLDEGVTRRVKHAYTTVDSISIKAGVLLRRYPLARVSVFCYIILLHVWVFIVLFLYAPK